MEGASGATGNLERVGGSAYEAHSFGVVGSGAHGGDQLMSDQLQQLKQAFKELHKALELKELHKALEVAESALIEFEETLGERDVLDRHWGQRSKELLSIPDLCQELGVGRSWVLTKLKTGEIPSIKLDQTIKVKREDLDKYLDSQR